MLGMLVEFGPVTGLDMSEKAAAHCRRRFGDQVDVQVGRIPADLTGSPEVVTAFDVLEHIDEDLAAVRAVHDALPEDGLFVCTVPALPFLWSRHDEVHHHHRRYTRRTLANLLRQGGFRVERLTYFNSFLFPLAAGIRLFHRLRPPASASDLALPPAPLNAVLTSIFASEGRLLRRASLPVGVSLLAVCRKRPV
jgi:SAM-dependent methyltransferase